MIIRASLTGLVVAAALTLAACGDGGTGVSKTESDQLQKQSTELQQKANKTAEDIKSGKVDAEQASKELQADATKLADDSIEAVKDADIPDEAKKQLEDAQKQLEAANGDK
jgi:DNA gyrase/topoisomerase IV subunit A